MFVEQEKEWDALLYLKLFWEKKKLVIPSSITIYA
jgi:hypothetical protein